MKAGDGHDSPVVNHSVFVLALRIFLAMIAGLPVDGFGAMR
jgi:hypothetical protein